MQIIKKTEEEWKALIEILMLMYLMKTQPEAKIITKTCVSVPYLD